MASRRPDRLPDEPLHQLVANRTLRHLREGLRVDADRIGKGPRPAAIQFDPLAVDRRAEHAVGTVAKVAGVFFGLETHDVIGAEIGQQLAGDRQGFQHRRRRKRHVEEKSERTAESLLAQEARQRKQVVIVRPHDVVGLQHRAERRGEATVDRQIVLVVLAAKLHEAKPEMQQGPQHTIGEADIEAAVGLCGQIDHGIGHAARFSQRRLRRRLDGKPAAPSEPHRTRCQQVAQRDGEPARHRAACLWIGTRVGDDHNACHSPSSQLRDSRMADRINPTCE